MRARRAGTQELNLPGLLQLLLSPTEQLRELQLALATAAGVPANAQVCHCSPDPCMPALSARQYASTHTSGFFLCLVQVKGLHSTCRGVYTDYWFDKYACDRQCMTQILHIILEFFMGIVA